jgi:hypothetical protein
MSISFAQNAGFTPNVNPAWAGDVLTRDHNLPGGAKLDAAAFQSADAVKAVVGAAGAAVGAVSIPVDALSGAIPANTFLNFGTLAPVVVTVGAAGALAAATTVPVDALSGPIPNGTVIHLGTNKFVVLNAAAAAGATSLTTLAIPTAVVDNDTGTFKGGTRQARVTTAAAKNATSIAVDELQFALADDDVAYYDIPGMKRRVAAGTVIGWTHAEMEAAAAGGLLLGPAADTDDIVRLVLFDVPDVDSNPDCELYRAGGLLKVNFLPTWADLSSTVKTKLRAQYETTVGGPGAEVPAS